MNRFSCTRRVYLKAPRSCRTSPLLLLLLMRLSSGSSLPPLLRPYSSVRRREYAGSLFVLPNSSVCESRATDAGETIVDLLLVLSIAVPTSCARVAGMTGPDNLARVCSAETFLGMSTKRDDSTPGRTLPRLRLPLAVVSDRGSRTHIAFRAVFRFVASSQTAKTSTEVNLWLTAR